MQQALRSTVDPTAEVSPFPDLGQSAQEPEVAGPGIASADGKAAAGAPGDGDGKVAYEDLLGTYLGGELYKAVGGVLTQDKLGSAAKASLDAAFEWLSKIPPNERVDPAVLPALLAVLRKEVDGRVGKYLEEHGGEITTALKDWSDAHPAEVVGVALLAAVGAVLADVGVPELKQKFGLGGSTTLGVEAQVGSLRHLALNHVKATLESKSGSLVLAHDDGKTTLDGKVGDDKRSIGASAEIVDKGVRLTKLSGLWTNDDGSTKVEGTANREADDQWSGQVTVTDVTGERRRVDSASYNAVSGTLHLEDVLEASDGSYKTNVGLTRDDKGTTVDAGGSYKDGDATYDGRLSAGPNESSLRAGYTDPDRSLGASINRRDGATNYALQGSLKDGDQRYTGSLARNGGDLGLNAGYQDPSRSVNASLNRTAAGSTVGLDGSWTGEGGSVQAALSEGPNGTAGKLGGSWRKSPSLTLDGSVERTSSGTNTRLGGQWTGENGSASGSLQHGPNGNQADLKLRYSKDDLMAELNASLASRGASSISGSIKSGSHSLAADASFGLDDHVLHEVGFKYGFEDPNQFRKFLVEARRKMDVDQTTFSLLAQDKISDIYWRLQASAHKTQDRFGYDATAQAAKYVSPSTALVVGMHGIRDDVTGQSRILPQVGVQYSGMPGPVMVEYDPKSKRVGVTLGIKF